MAPALTATLADLSVNLAAGYFGVALLSPGLSRKKGVSRVIFLTNYLVGGMLWVGLAYYLRTLL